MINIFVFWICNNKWFDSFFVQKIWFDNFFLSNFVKFIEIKFWQLWSVVCDFFVLSFEVNKRLRRNKETVVKYLCRYIICEKKIRNKNFIVLLPFVCSTKYYIHIKSVVRNTLFQ